MEIGLFRGTVILQSHDPKWVILACQTIDSLRKVLGKEAAIEHVGSTSINGIKAKPIIDIVIGIKSFDEVLSKNEVLEEAGFSFRGQDHPDQYLYVCGQGDFITHHIHVVLYGSSSWQNYLNFRDYLNSHPRQANEYSLLKEKLASRYSNDRKSYTALKSEFILEVLEKARRWKDEGKE